MYKNFTVKAGVRKPAYRKIWLVMQLTTVLLTAALMQVSAAGFAQKISVSLKNASIESVLREIRQQSGYNMYYDGRIIPKNKRVDIAVADVSVSEALGELFSALPLTFQIDGQTIAIKERGDTVSPSTAEVLVLAYPEVRGRVVDSVGKPLVGASVRVLNAEGKRTTLQTKTDRDGYFVLQHVPEDGMLEVTFVGYVVQTVAAVAEVGTLVLEMVQSELEEVEVTMVNTGYYQVPKERATGSFTHVSNKLINRSVSTNILQRLEGVVNGVQFIDPQASDASGIRIRGLSTILADTRPLIVVDNFPYEGDINTINPNDVESITVLRDASAASIWGARAGNGVIVINTKQGAYNQPSRISVNSNVTIGEEPDLFYSQHYLPSTTVMEIQRELFEGSAYRERDQTYIPSYVELLIKQRDGLINEENFKRQEAFMQQTDLRSEISKYLYQPSVNQQYSLGVRGGGTNYRYALSAGYDRNRSHVIGNDAERLNLSLQNTFRIKPGLELTGTVWYTRRRAANNGISHTEIGPFNTATNSSNIYYALRNADGSAAFTHSTYRQAFRENAVSNGLLDWMYRPLDELKLLDNTNGGSELRLNTGVKYRFLENFDLNLTYQYTLADGWSREYHDPASYYVRNLVNRFTQQDGTRLIPHGGILELGEPQESQSHSGRAQLNFNKQIDADNQLAALAGAEIRQRIAEIMPNVRLYDYNDDLWMGITNLDYQTMYSTRPSGFAWLPPTSIISPARQVGRDLSYFGNASYTHKQRYILSGSVRWDGSNLLGVKTNQRGTALWSIGGSWDVSKEPSYGIAWLPYLRLRTTYGSAGNIDKSQSHYPTISMSVNTVTGYQQAVLRHAGNPSLRWEQVNTFNAGLDWRLFGNRISGSIEYYNKHAKYLLGDNLMDPTTGVGSNYKINYANLRTQGWDAQLNTVNLTGIFRWETRLLVNYTYNRVTAYNGPELLFGQHFTGNPVKKGESVDLIYALPWHGLNPETGYPVIYQNGEMSDEYADYYQSLTPEDVRSVGVRVPPLFGSIQNRIEFKGFEVSALVTFKSGYVFRRQSIGPGQEYFIGNQVFHMDYFKRWQKPGDERHTNVPARSAGADFALQESAISNLYRDSDALITRGDQIRLQDVSLSYTMQGRQIGLPSLENVRLYGYARNLGIIWRANKSKLDPDYPDADYTAPRTFALGLQINF